MKFLQNISIYGSTSRGGRFICFWRAGVIVFCWHHLESWHRLLPHDVRIARLLISVCIYHPHPSGDLSTRKWSGDGQIFRRTHHASRIGRHLSEWGHHFGGFQHPRRRHERPTWASLARHPRLVRHGAEHRWSNTQGRPHTGSC